MALNQSSQGDHPGYDYKSEMITKPLAGFIVEPKAVNPGTQFNKAATTIWINELTGHVHRGPVDLEAGGGGGTANTARAELKWGDSAGSYAIPLGAVGDVTIDPTADAGRAFLTNGDFTESNGVITYTGASTVYAAIAFSATLTPLSTGYGDIKIKKNGTVVSASGSTNDSVNLYAQAFTTLSTGNTISVTVVDNPGADFQNISFMVSL